MGFLPPAVLLDYFVSSRVTVQNTNYFTMRGAKMTACSKILFTRRRQVHSAAWTGLNLQSEAQYAGFSCIYTDFMFCFFFLFFCKLHILLTRRQWKCKSPLVSVSRLWQLSSNVDDYLPAAVVLRHTCSLSVNIEWDVCVNRPNAQVIWKGALCSPRFSCCIRSLNRRFFPSLRDSSPRAALLVWGEPPLPLSFPPHSASSDKKKKKWLILFSSSLSVWWLLCLLSAAAGRRSERPAAATAGENAALKSR